MSKKLTDNSIMTWGEYIGEKLANIPGHYFLWRYDQTWFNHVGLKEYIEGNMDSFKLETKNYENDI